MRPHLIAAAAFGLFAVFVVGEIVTTSPTYDEPAHLVSGYSYLTTHDFRLNPEHPPLLKMIAAAPLLPMRIAFPGSADARAAWSMALANVDAEWSVARFWFPSDAPFFRARLAMALLGLLLGALIYLWSTELWGAWGGAISVTLFALDPNFIAHSALVTTDVGVSLLIFASVYFFWRWHRKPTPANAIAVAVAFALAQIAKFSAVVLVPIFIVLAIRYVFSRPVQLPGSGRRQAAPAKAARARSVMLLAAVTAVITIAVIWGAYGFRFSAAADPDRAADDEAIARAMPDHHDLDAPEFFLHGHFPLRVILQAWAARKELAPIYPHGVPGEVLARERVVVPLGISQRAILFAGEHRLLPEAYLFGVSWVGSLSVFRTSFLNGEYSDTGFPSFFFWTFLYKTPVPAIIAIVAGLWLARRRIQQNAAPFLFWPVGIYFGLSLMQNLNIGHRHLLPIYPFLYVACGSLGLIRRRAGTIAGAALLLVLLASDTWMYGRHLSYMNVPNGWSKLNDSNFDWGQDLKRLGEWTRANNVREPINLLYFGTADPKWYGIAHHNLRNAAFPDPPQVPGYFAISSADYIGLFSDPAHRTYWNDYLARAHARHVGTAGSTIFIYRIEKRP